MNLLPWKAAERLKMKKRQYKLDRRDSLMFMRENGRTLSKHAMMAVLLEQTVKQNELLEQILKRLK